MADFVHLAACSSCSYLHAASSPEALVQAAAAHGMDTLALTDRDNPYGAPRFERACLAAGIRPIHGVELRTTTGDALLLLVRDADGWANLCRLTSAANFAGSKGRPRLDPAMLGQFAGGLTAILLPQGHVATRLRLGDERGARDALDSHRAIYGERSVYLALTDHLTAPDGRRNGLLAAWATAVGGHLVATNAVRMATPAERPLLDVLDCVREHTTLAAAGTCLSPNREAHLKRGGAMAALFSWCPQAIRNSRKIAEECRFTLAEVAFRPPAFPLPAGEAPFSYLFKVAHAGAHERYPRMTPEAMAQLTRELDIIHRLGYAEYFLFTWDIARFCREKGILMQGRGSAACSVVAYVLGITAVDPIRYGLLFERFLSLERASPPDIDIDIEHERREEVIQYLYQKWGRDRSGMVCNVNTYHGASALIDAGKALGIPHQRATRLTKVLGHHRGDRMATAITDELGASDRAVDWLTRLVAAMEGVPRHASIHNGGFVVTQRPLAECLPLEKARMKDRTVTIYDKDDIEALGYIKTDVLGLGMLTCIRKCFDAIKQTAGATLTLDTVPLEDPAVYDDFCRGDTVGVFQIESRAQQATLPRTKPRTLYDLVIETALIRPGPIQGDSVSPLIRRRQGKEPVTYPHDDLEPILRRTYGVVLYQEQGMRCAMQIAGFSAGEADLVRRAMGSKRSVAAMAGLKERFVSGGRDRGYDDDVTLRVWEMIQGFALYGFAESHAASFALLIAVSGYVKHHYPAQFLCSLLNAQPMGFYSVGMLISDAERHGVTVLPVDIQRSGYDHRMERGDDGTWAVRLGLRLVAGVGEGEEERIETESRRPYANLHDVLRRLPLDRDVLTNLAAVGAFGSLGLSRREALWAVRLVDAREDLLPDTLPEIPALPSMTAEEEVRLDYAILGCAPGNRHLMTFYRALMDEWGVIPAAALADVPHGAAVRVGGIVAIRQRPGTARGVAFFTLEDETGVANVVVMPDVFRRHRTPLRLASMLAIKGRVERVDGVINVRAEHVRPFGEDNEAAVLLSKQFA